MSLLNKAKSYVGYRENVQKERGLRRKDKLVFRQTEFQMEMQKRWTGRWKAGIKGESSEAEREIWELTAYR